MASSTESAVEALRSTGVESFAEKVGNVSETVSKAAAVPQGLMKLGGAYESLDKANKYGTKQEIEDAKLDLASSGLGALKSQTSLISNVAGQFSTGAATAVGTAAKKMGGVLGLGTQGISLFKNIRHMKESSERKRSMAASIKAMKDRASGNMSEDEKEKLAIFRQGKRSAKLDKKQSAFGTVSALSVFSDPCWVSLEFPLQAAPSPE